ncbi:ethanolamine ammonia-lyase reactivating factor EutA [Cohnella yongneupensis]|uniref:Ethanolamine ammonia-lyase reactivating factor EutA n=1 Tax=Cohnella yongneupensis TaxID=425006 RepID=A0ABW0QUT9_9BACL
MSRGLERAEWLTSAGIDIGTSTTKLIVSRLKLARTSGALSLPRYGIAARELLYASPIYSTPLLGEDEIDVPRIESILSKEFAKAGIRKQDLKSGAIIITGETATKANASRMIHLLAEQAGDFVVATAGADLEGMLAGKGAGADERSLAVKGAVANIDVGGGTANVAIFHRGKPVGTVTYRVGGSLIRLDPTGRISAISPSLMPWLQASRYRLKQEDTISFAECEALCKSLACAMIDDLIGIGVAENDERTRALLLGKPLQKAIPIEEWMVSGGIGSLMEMKHPANMAETAAYGDIGPLLAHSLKRVFIERGLRLVPAVQTVRATVIGAGMQSSEISGATVWLESSLLPLRNLPVLKLAATAGMLESPVRLAETLEETMRLGAGLYGSDASPPFALAMSGISDISYAAMQSFADAFCSSYTRFFPKNGAAVVICDGDVAQAMGQALRKRTGGRPKVMCIDQIRVEHGDYIDLGEPISGMMIPVVVKTLAWPGRTEGNGSG